MMIAPAAFSRSTMNASSVRQHDGVQPVRVHQLLELRIVVASTSIPAALVFGGFAARLVGAAAPDAPSKRASRAVRTRERRSRLLIA
jgi:hypothetical protein